MSVPVTPIMRHLVSPHCEQNNEKCHFIRDELLKKIEWHIVMLMVYLLHISRCISGVWWDRGLGYV